jgi:hypothetical protein
MRALAVFCLLVASACQTTGMSFTREDRLAIETPQPREVVDLPVEVRWNASSDLERDVEDSDGELYFAVFVDRAPIRGGKDISDMVDAECRRTPGCGDEAWFNERGVYFTSQGSIVVRELEDLRHDRDREDRDLHKATVVVMRRAEEPVLDALYDGTRDGEGAVSVQFWLDRRSA